MRLIRRHVVAAALCQVAFISVALTQSYDSRPATPKTDLGIERSFGELDNLVHFGDLISVDVVGSSEYDWRGKLTPEGALSGFRFTEFPVIGLCRSPAEISREVERYYSKFLNQPEVNVEILDRSDRPLAIILGAVKNPQRFRLEKDVRLREIVVLAGGFSENANGEIEILRQPSAACLGFSAPVQSSGELNENASFASKESEYRTFRIKDLLSDSNSANVKVYYGDLITVKSAAPVYVIGSVQKPGPISISEGLTLERAVLAAGGAATKRNKFEIRVFRRNAGKAEIIEFAVESSESKAYQEFEVREYDIVEVFGDSSEKLSIPPVIQDLEERELRVTSLPIRIIN